MRSSSTIRPDLPVGELGRQVQQTARQASPWIEPLGRFGYAAKGVVYSIVGILAIQAALGSGGQTTDQRGALAQVAQAPFGRALLVVLTIGLVGYAVWRFVQAILDTENKGSETKGKLIRALYAGIGVVYLGLAFSALRLLIGDGGSSGQQQTQDWTARLLGHPLGAWVVGLAGLAVIGNGLYQLYRAYSAKFRQKLRLQEMSQEQVEWVTRLGRAGFAARGVSFGLIGLFLVVAAVQTEPQEARGLDGALAALAAQPYGPYLLGLVALGLLAYGLFALVEARYRRMLLS